MKTIILATAGAAGACFRLWHNATQRPSDQRPAPAMARVCRALPRPLNRCGAASVIRVSHGTTSDHSSSLTSDG